MVWYLALDDVSWYTLWHRLLVCFSGRGGRGVSNAKWNDALCFNNDGICFFPHFISHLAHRLDSISLSQPLAISAKVESIILLLFSISFDSNANSLFPLSFNFPLLLSSYCLLCSLRFASIESFFYMQFQLSEYLNHLNQFRIYFFCSSLVSLGFHCVYSRSFFGYIDFHLLLHDATQGGGAEGWVRWWIRWMEGDSGDCMCE